MNTMPQLSPSSPTSAASSTTSADPALAPLNGAGRPGLADRPRRRPSRRGFDRFLLAYTWLIIAFLCVPIAVIILFSFNDVRKSNFVWLGFTTKWYGRLLEHENLREAVLNSVTIALLAMVISAVLGTLLGLAMGRYRFFGSGLVMLIVFAAIASPELVMGASLLTLFVQFEVPRGFLTILFAHVMFCIPYVAAVVRARVQTLDPSLEEAARDLGAGPFDTFRLVTLPMVFPAVLSGGLLAFVLSIDDFIITNFVSGSTSTFPLWIWAAERKGLPPSANAVGTIIFVVGVAIAAIIAISGRRSVKR